APNTMTLATISKAMTPTTILTMLVQKSDETTKAMMTPKTEIMTTQKSYKRQNKIPKEWRKNTKCYSNSKDDKEAPEKTVYRNYDDSNELQTKFQKRLQERRLQSDKRHQGREYAKRYNNSKRATPKQRLHKDNSEINK
ncbi:45829_t:CDS:2, partial [Gigaspora margarita]